MITHINNYTFKSFKNYTGPIETPFKEKIYFFAIMVNENLLFQKEYLMSIKKKIQ